MIPFLFGFYCAFGIVFGVTWCFFAILGTRSDSAIIALVIGVLAGTFWPLLIFKNFRNLLDAIDYY